MAGVEFIPQHGVRFRGNVIEEYQGREGFREFYDDVYTTARNEGGELCIFNGVPEKIVHWLGEDWYELHTKRMVEIKDNYKKENPDIKLMGDKFIGPKDEQ